MERLFVANAEKEHKVAAVMAVDRDFEFREADFTRIRALIYQHAGIHLNPSKQNMVYGRLVRRLRDTGVSSFEAYLNALEAHPQSGEWQQFVNALTTNLTSFFREEHHFPVLAEHLRSLRNEREIRIWCAAASTGEEPYSIAMTALETLGFSASIRILASDIDTNVLATAKKGVYSIENMRNVSQERLRKFFQKGSGSNAGLARVRPEVARIVEFQQINLLAENWPFRQPFHLVFCRNVMIYFDKPTQRRILEKMHRTLPQGGLLFVGHSENFVESRDLFHLRGKTVYEKE